MHCLINTTALPQKLQERREDETDLVRRACYDSVKQRPTTKDNPTHPLHNNTGVILP